MVTTNPTFDYFDVKDAWEGELFPREAPYELDVYLETWHLNYDIVLSWNGLFGDYLPLARLSDEITRVAPISVDIQHQLALDVLDVFPDKKYPTAGLTLGKVYNAMGDELHLGNKYRQDSALDDCWRMFSIYCNLLNGQKLPYDYVAYGGSKKLVDHHATITPSERTLTALRGGKALKNDVRCDLDWANITIPASVTALLSDEDETNHKPILRFALQMLAPTVNERLRAQIRDGITPEKKDLERLQKALERTP